MLRSPPALIMPNSIPKLNLFARAMQAWDETLPYNAVHSIQINRELDPERIPMIVSRAIEQHSGLSYLPDKITIEHISPTGDIEEDLRSANESQLNQRFDRNHSEPFIRFFILPIDEENFILGLCYYHLIASADSICWLLESIVADYCETAIPHLDTRPEKRQSSYRWLLLKQAKFFFLWLAGASEFSKKVRAYSRLPRRHREGAKSRVATLSLSATQRAWIRDQTKQTGATFNDVVMGLALHSLAKHGPEQASHSRRNDLAVSSIVNIRQHFGPQKAGTFGLFLAVFSVSLPLKTIDSLGETFQRIHKQTERIKKDRLYLRNLFYVSFGTFWRKFLSKEQQENLNLKSFPLAASITNFFVDRFQNHLFDLPVSNYWRSVSSSPATPLVISATTFKDCMHLNFIYNDAIYESEEVASIADGIAKAMDSL